MLPTKLEGIKHALLQAAISYEVQK
jgi:hypothetical protein